MYYVYVLWSPTANRLYVGQTSDLRRRLKEHEDHIKYPKSFTARQPGPWHLVRQERFPTRFEAIKREAWLKTGMGYDWLLTQLRLPGPLVPLR